MKRLVSVVLGMVSTALAMSAISVPAVGDDFESYAIGTFPAAEWLDVGLVNPDPPNPPDPSALIAVTDDPLGDPTQVLATLAALAPSQGIYRSVEVRAEYSVSADVRVDRFSDGAEFSGQNWAMQVGLGKLIAGEDPCCGPQCGIFADSFKQSWRVYVAGTKSGFLTEIELGIGVDIGRWYRVAMDLNATTGEVRSRVTDLATMTLLVDVTNPIKGWGPDEGLYDIVCLMDGELAPESKISNLAVVDNTQFCCDTASIPGVASPSVQSQLRVYPNPMRSGGVVAWTNAARAGSALKLYDPSGRHILTHDLTGRYAVDGELNWGDLVQGRSLQSGIYFLRLVAPSGPESAVRVTLIR
jgi:hypothetical protein